MEDLKWMDYAGSKYTTTESGRVSDDLLEQNNLLVIRGIIVDGLFLNDAYGRMAVRKWHEKRSKKEKKLRANN